MKRGKWTQETALATLRELMTEIPGLAQGRAYSEKHMQWIVCVLEILEEVFGRDSRYYLTFAAFTWNFRGGVVQAFDLRAALDVENRKAFLRELESAKGLLQAAYGALERKGLDDVYEDDSGVRAASTTLSVVELIERGLRKAMHFKPTVERDVQDIFENLLIGAGLPYSREAERIEFSSKTYVPDFTIADLGTAIEMKLCNREGREKELIDEIGADISAYKTKFKNLVFVIYDIGFIRDVDRFIRSFERGSNTVVRVIKH